MTVLQKSEEMAEEHHPYQCHDIYDDLPGVEDPANDETKISLSDMRRNMELQKNMIVELAPPTKQLMKWKATHGWQALLSNSAKCYIAVQLQMCFRRVLNTEWGSLDVHGDELIYTANKQKSSGSIACEICGKECTTKKGLKRHKRLHTGDQRFQCAVCPKRFIDRRNLKVHMQHHGEAKTYKCHTCAKFFKSKSNLTHHQHIHMGSSKNYHSSGFCDICNNGKYYRRINEHKRNMHT